jgi:hypothetical protein
MRRPVLPFSTLTSATTQQPPHPCGGYSHILVPSPNQHPTAKKTMTPPQHPAESTAPVLTFLIFKVL